MERKKWNECKERAGYGTLILVRHNDLLKAYYADAKPVFNVIRGAVHTMSYEEGGMIMVGFHISYYGKYLETMLKKFEGIWTMSEEVEKVQMGRVVEM